MTAVILTCNAGSSNTKLAAFDAVSLARKGHATTHNAADTLEWICSVGERSIVAVGHRVVHGGQEFAQPVRTDDNVMARLKAYVPLAPLHQPAALKLIEETRRMYPDVPHVACFDTAFHHTMPEIERRLPLARRFHEEGMLRYGFHGLSYQHIADVLPEYAGVKAYSRVIVAHLGGGSSACAMKDLRSVGSTMGFSTLDGLMMGTRCGALDPGAILYLLTEKGMPVQEVTELLYHHAGLKGVSGTSGDLRDLLASGNLQAKEAVELYCHLAVRQIAGLLPALGGLDALVFTGGIGENAVWVRERIAGLLRWAGNVPVYVIPADEETVIAHACRSYLA
jgi:acetate kinase